MFNKHYLSIKHLNIKHKIFYTNKKFGYEQSLREYLFLYRFGVRGQNNKPAARSVLVNSDTNW